VTEVAPFASAVPVDLDGRVAVVTGASSGLGERFARVLASRGARVVVTARREDRLTALVDDLGADRAHVVAGDIVDPATADRVVAEAVARFGRLDVLVNNAGATNVARAEDESVEDFARVIGVNLVAVFACCRAAYRPMRVSGGGSVVNVASALGLVGIGRIPQASYCASKGGVVNLTRELAAQWGRDGIRVNAVAPGWFPSEMTGSMLDDERSLGYIRRTVPLGRPGRSDELDDVVSFLAGPGSTYVTGQTFAVDGGWTSV
jgi:NAD(P)-dependent dehydrogenase (short-subunit alcohol dehydrogenase family)